MDTFPAEFFNPTTFQVYPAGSVTGGGVSAVGFGSKVDWSGSRGWWVGVYTGLRLNKPAHHKYFRAMLMRLGDGINTGIMPIHDFAENKPFPAGYDPYIPHVQTHSDGTTFSDGTGYVSRAIDYEVTEPAAMGDIALTVRLKAGRALEGGEYFTLVHAIAGERLYLIDRVKSLGGGLYRIGFGPRLRDDVEVGAFVDFEKLRLRMTIEGDPKELWPILRRAAKDTRDVTFVEDLSYQRELTA